MRTKIERGPTLTGEECNDGHRHDVLGLCLRASGLPCKLEKIRKKWSGKRQLGSSLDRSKDREPKALVLASFLLSGIAAVITSQSHFFFSLRSGDCSA